MKPTDPCSDPRRRKLLALGGALVVGNGLALLRPPVKPKPGELARAPIGRTVAMLVAGVAAALALVTLGLWYFRRK